MVGSDNQKNLKENIRNRLHNEISDQLLDVKIYQSLNLPDFKLRGMRKKSDKRLEIILNHLNPSGKSVLDLGCSNGYFCYELTNRGADVTGYDHNAKVIELNRNIVNYYGWSTHFKEAYFDLEFFNALDTSDAVLFLAVLHHIFNHTFVDPIAHCREIISILSQKTDLLFFEMGQSGEPFHWSMKLAMMEPDPKEWIISNIFRDSNFSVVDVFEPPEFTSGRLKDIKRRVWELNRRWSVLLPLHYVRKLVAHMLVKIFINDPRDTRYIFVARK